MQTCWHIIGGSHCRNKLAHHLGCAGKGQAMDVGGDHVDSVAGHSDGARVGVHESLVIELHQQERRSAGGPKAAIQLNPQQLQSWRTGQGSRRYNARQSCCSCLPTCRCAGTEGSSDAARRIDRPTSTCRHAQEQQSIALTAEAARTWGPSRESRRAETRANTCCTVSLKGATVAFLMPHSIMRSTVA